MEEVRGADDVDDVIRAQQGDDQAFSALFDRWFDRVHDVASHIVRDPSVSAEVAQDVFLNAWQKLDTLREPSAFGGWLLRSARNRALNRLEQERRSTPIGTEETMVEIDRRLPETGTAEANLDLDWHQRLVWAASAALGERDASILSLHLRHGLDAPELADELGVTPNNAHQLLFRLRERLGEAIASWVVWREGSPRCDDLRLLLDKAGQSAFDRTTAKTVRRHCDDCDVCGAERAAGVAPQAVFAGVPVLVAPAVLKTRVAAALEANGVPISSSPSVEAGGPRQQADGAESAVGPSGEAPHDPTQVTELSTGPAPLPAAPTAPGVPRADATTERRSRRRALLALGAAALILAVAFLATRSTGGPTATDATDEQAQSTSAPSSSSTTTSTTSTSTSTTLPTTTTSTPAPSSTDPPAPAPPTPTTPPVVNPTTVPTVDPGPAPTINGFRVFRRAAPGCATPSEVVRITWSTVDATEVLISGPGAPTASLAPAGSIDLCAAGPATFRLFASGPGGTTPSGEQTV